MAPWAAPARIEAAVKFLRGRLIMVVPFWRERVSRFGQIIDPDRRRPRRGAAKFRLDEVDKCAGRQTGAPTHWNIGVNRQFPERIGGLLRGVYHRAALRADPLARNDARYASSFTCAAIGFGAAPPPGFRWNSYVIRCHGAD